MWLHHVAQLNPLSTAARSPDLCEGHWALLHHTKAQLWKCRVFLCRGRWWTFIRSSRHLLGDLQCVGVCSRECVSRARQERPRMGAEMEPVRDCLATAGSPNVSLTKKSWMSYDEGSAHTLTHTLVPLFNHLYAHTNLQAITQVGNLLIYQFINAHIHKQIGVS